MRVRIIQCLSGPEFTLNPGDETERFGDAEAKRLISAGIAEVVGKAPPKKAAAKPAAKGKK
jgi:hypothetical protein